MTDSVTSNGLHAYIQERGGKHLRYRRGYKNVISKGVELNRQGTSCELMMETRHALSTPVWPIAECQMWSSVVLPMHGPCLTPTCKPCRLQPRAQSWGMHSNSCVPKETWHGPSL